MNPAPIQAVYGDPPRHLCDVAVDAVQYSPLVPGAERLDARAAGSLAGAVIYAPPGTLERRYVCALMLRALAVGAPLTVLAPKDKGGSRIADELRGFGCAVGEQARSHHRICLTHRPETVIGIEETLAECGPRQVDETGFWTQPGVFSWDRLDGGSAVLLKHLPALRGRGVDLGCGLGVLSRAVLGSAAVEALTLVDLDRRAMEMARKNVPDGRAEFIWGDVRTVDLAAGTYDFVVMNPPFHENGAEHRALGQMFIARAAQLLRRGGVCWLVANRHLPYEAELCALFRQVHLVVEAGGFKIYRAEK